MQTPKNSSGQCNFCGESQNELVQVAVLEWDSEADEKIDPENILWVCKDHFTVLLKSDDYRIRELPDIPGEIDHSLREEIEESPKDRQDYVAIVDPENENKWLKAPHDLETDLNDER